MALFTMLGNEVFAPYDYTGEPRRVVNEDAQRWATEVESVLKSFGAGGGVIFPNKATADANLAYAQNTMAWIVGDDNPYNNGVYRKFGASGVGSWIRVADLPYDVIRATVGAGSPNLINASTSIPVTSSSLVIVPIAGANTATPVKIRFNGGEALTIKSNTGADIAIGGLQTGMRLLGTVEGSDFRLFSDQVSASIIAQAEAWANVALAAANGNLVFINRSTAAAATISASIHSLELRGWASEYDGNGGLFTDDSSKGSTSLAEQFVSSGGTSRRWYRVRDVNSKLRIMPMRIDDAPRLVQKKLMEPNFGYDPGTAGGSDTSIYPGAGFTAQAPCYVELADGTKKMFVMQRCVADNYLVSERCRIAMFPFREDGGLGTCEAYSEELNIGHGGSALSYTGNTLGTLKFYAWMPTMSGHEGNDSGKGFSVITWNGALTSQANVVGYQVFGWNASSDPRKEYYHMDCAVDPTGTHIVFIGYRAPTGGDGFGTQQVFIFRLQDLIAAANDAARMAINPISSWLHPIPHVDRGIYKQGLGIRKGRIATMSGFTNIFVPEVIRFFDFHGNITRTLKPTGPRAEYGYDLILNNPTLGTPMQFEPEGLTWISDDEIAWMIMEQWRKTASVVKYKSPSGVEYRFARIGSGTANPTQVDQWVRTTMADDRGDWVNNPSPAYTIGTAIHRRAKVIYSLRVPRGDAGEIELSAGMPNGWDQEVPLNTYECTPNASFKAGTAYNVAGWSSVFKEYMLAYTYVYSEGGASALRVTDFWNQAGGGFQIGFQWPKTGVSGREIGSIQFGDGAVGGQFMYGLTDTSSPGQWILRTRSSGGLRLSTGTTGALSPFAAGANLGGTTSPEVRWGTLFCQNNPNVSSDARGKQDIDPLTQAEIDAAMELGAAVIRYRRKRSVENKDSARLHIGYTVQNVMEIMAKHGLDPFAYSMICRNEWEASDEVYLEEQDTIIPAREAGYELSLRYEQIHSFVDRGQQEQLDRLSRRISELEAVAA